MLTFLHEIHSETFGILHSDTNPPKPNKIQFDEVAGKKGNKKQENENKNSY